MMLHETAVAWIRLRLARTVPDRAWLESREEYSMILKRVCDDVNSTCNVEGLCRDFMKRVDQLDRQGGGLAQ